MGLVLSYVGLEAYHCSGWLELLAKGLEPLVDCRLRLLKLSACALDLRSAILVLRSVIWSFRSLADLVEAAELGRKPAVGVVEFCLEDERSACMARFSRDKAADVSIPRPRMGGILTLSGVVLAVLGL